MFLALKNALGKPLVATFKGLLDSFSGASAAYSLRRLSGSYTGHALRIRRVSDEVEVDVGFNGGSVSTSSPITNVSGDSGDTSSTTLGEFITEGGSQDATVTTWYDQSGNEKNATQSTAGSQPKIASSGSLIVDSAGLIELEFDGSNDVLSAGTGFASSSKTVFCVNNPDALSGNGLFAFGSSQFDRFFAQYTSSKIRTEINGAQAAVSAATQPNLTTHLHTSDISIALNGASFTTTSASFSGVSSSAELRIGQRFGTGFTDNFDGTIQECIFYNSDESSNKTNIESNLSDFYDI